MDKLNEILKKMTLEDKLKFLTGDDSWHSKGFHNYGIKQLTLSDGPHALRQEIRDENGEFIGQKKVVVYPTASSIAASWNPELAYEIGAAIAEDCIENKVDVLLGPAINIKRNPLGGRNFEYYSEDPYVAAKMATEYIKGVQSKGIGTSLKHFAANNQEYDRLFGSSEIDERTLREIYLKAFEKPVKEAKPWTVMCAYNRVNGTFCSENKWLLDDVLRKEWGFEGVVVSDWTAVHDRAKALKASLELEMPFNDKSYNNLRNALDRNEISEELIDACVLRLLNLVEKSVEASTYRKTGMTEENKMELAYKAACESIVLLKNEYNTLPIDKEKYRNILVVGNYAKQSVIQGGGSSGATPVKIAEPYDEIIREYGKEYNIDFEAGYQCISWHTYNEIINTGDVINKAALADIVVLFAAESDKFEAEAYDRNGMRLHPAMENFIEDVAKSSKKIVLVLQAGAPIDIGRYEDKVSAIILQGYAGCMGGRAVADILFGRVNPSAKLAETFPASLEQIPSYEDKKHAGVCWYREGIMMGYRYYDYYGIKPRYPFGHGLSYSNYEYSNMTLEIDNKNEQVKIKLCITNKGEVPGKEIVQIYVGDVSACVVRPLKELKAFQKIELQPNEEQYIEFIISFEDLKYYSVVHHEWIIENGAFTFMAGASSEDIRLKKTVNIELKA